MTTFTLPCKECSNDLMVAITATLCECTNCGHVHDIPDAFSPIDMPDYDLAKGHDDYSNDPLSDLHVPSAEIEDVLPKETETFPINLIRCGEHVLDVAIIRPSNPRIGLVQDRLVLLDEWNNILGTLDLCTIFNDMPLEGDYIPDPNPEC